MGNRMGEYGSRRWGWASPRQTRPLVAVVIVCCAVMILCGAIVFALRHEPDRFNVRYVFFGYGSQVLSGFVIAAVATNRGFTLAQLKWLSPVVLVIAAAVIVPSSSEPSMGSISYVLAGAMGALAVPLGGSLFLAVGLPLWILVSALFPRRRRPQPVLWFCAATLTFVATCVPVGLAFDDLHGTPQGQGLAIFLRALGLPIGEVVDEGQLWILRALLVVLLVFIVLGVRSAKSERRVTTSPSVPNNPAARTRRELRRRRQG